MNKEKVVLYVSCVICFLMPVLSIEGIIPWILCLWFMHKNIKVYKTERNIKRILINTIICFLVIILYNTLARIIQDILVKLLV